MNRKSLLFVPLLLLVGSALLFAQTSPVSFGFGIMVGGRYDDLRMCVASPAGFKGGLIADVTFNTRVRLSDGVDMTFKLPVMRPLLFAFAFRMLQFEPEMTFDFKFAPGADVTFTGGFGVGLSLHYGPGYQADLQNRGEEFFAIGPYISGFVAVQFPGLAGQDTKVGIRAFYVPLFSASHPVGTVLGGALEGQMYFR
ncbi:MAG: hypothetical protein JXD23_03695 [Spirochaetales bacterium]|nr:hypothetical protein [Spirochaetales bacterium]